MSAFSNNYYFIKNNPIHVNLITGSKAALDQSGFQNLTGHLSL